MELPRRMIHCFTIPQFFIALPKVLPHLSKKKKKIWRYHLGILFSFHITFNFNVMQKKYKYLFNIQQL